MRTFNLRLVLWLIGIFLIVSIGVHLLHGYQVRKNAGAYRELAEREDAAARDETRTPSDRSTAAMRAVGHYRRYLALRPTDSAVRANYGKLLVLVGDYPRAYQQFERVLREMEDNDEVRRLQVDVSTRLGSFKDAQDHLNYLLDRQGGTDAELLELLGRIQFRVGDKDAADTLRKAFTAAPTRISAYKAYADLLRSQADNLPDPTATNPDGTPDLRTPSEKIIDQMVAANPQSADAYAKSAEYYLQERFKDEETRNRIERDIDMALQLGSDDADVLGFAAIAKAMLGQIDTARDLLTKSLAIQPDVISRYMQLIELEQPVNREVTAPSVAAALAVARRGLAAIPNKAVNFILRWRLAWLLQDQTQLLRQRRDAKQEEVERQRLGGENVDTAPQELAELTRTLRDAEAELQQLLVLLDKERSDSPEVTLLKARQLARDEKWFEAQQLLESLRTELTRLSPAVAQYIQKLLAFCYARLGNADQQLQAFRRVREDNPYDVNATLNYAMALERLGRLNDAQKQYDELERLLSDSQFQSEEAASSKSANLASLAKQRFSLELRLAQAQPDSPTKFAVVEQCLQRVQEANPDDPWLPVARADFALARGNKEESRDILTAAVDTHPNDLTVHLALFNLALNQRDFDAAARKLDDTRARFPDSVRLRLARAELLIKRDGQAGLSQLGELAEGISDVFSKGEQSQLYLGLAFRSASLNAARAIEFARQAAALNPDNVGIRLLMLQLARGEGDVATAEESAKVIETVEHGGPVSLFARASVEFARYRAARNALGPDSKELPDPKPLEAARELLRKAEQTRPDWVELRTLAGDVALQLGDNNDALSHYQRALALGSRDPAVIAQTWLMLRQRGREAEAGELSSLAREMQQPTPIVARAIGVLALEQGEFALAREMLEIPIELNAADANVFVLQALSFMREGNYGDADKSLNQALERDASRRDLWLTKIQVLVEQAKKAKRDGKAEEFGQRVEQARQAAAQGTERVAAQELPLFQAQIAALLASVADLPTPEADQETLQTLLQLYAQAIEAAPKDVETLEAAVQFYLSTSDKDARELAIPLLEQIASGEVTENDTERANARRSLASLLGAKPGYRAFREAIEYSDLNLGRKRAAAGQPFWPEELTLSDEELAKAVSEKRDDLWVRARILAPRGLPSLQRESLRILEALASQVGTPPAGMDMMMSELYMGLGNRRLGMDKLRSIIGEAYEKQRYAEFVEASNRYIDLLLEQAEITEAADWVRRVKGTESRINDRWIHTAIREARLVVPRTVPGQDPLPWKVANALQIVRTAVEDDNVKPLYKNYRREVAIAFLENVLADAAQNRTKTEQDEIRQEIDRYFQEFIADGTAQLATVTDQTTSALGLANLQLLRVPYLARQGQRVAAIELIRQYWQQAAPKFVLEALAELVSVKAALRRINESRASDAEREQAKKDVLTAAAEAEQILVKAAEAYQAQGEKGEAARQGVMMLLAELYLGTQRFADAIAAYRDVLSNQPENVIALNNTAMMLATTNPAQARKQIEIAMELVGPVPTIVDSYAMILLANGEKEQALAAARRAISEKPVLLDPEFNRAMARQWGGYYFHLAAILDANGRTEEALQAMGEALRLGAEESDVFEPERPLWHRMLDKWNAAKAKNS